MPPNKSTARPKNGKLDASELGRLRSHLARMGVKQADIKAAIGDDIDNRDRAAIVAQLRAWLKERPKA